MPSPHLCGGGGGWGGGPPPFAHPHGPFHTAMGGPGPYGFEGPGGGPPAYGDGGAHADGSFKRRPSDELTEEERRDRRRAQNREAQRRFRQKRNAQAPAGGEPQAAGAAGAAGAAAASAGDGGDSPVPTRTGSCPPGF
jgi:hypothetical protein